MKKITEIKLVDYEEVQDWIDAGWRVHGYPLLTVGSYSGPYQCMVKYSD